jgi:hypothetical protein
MMTPEQLEAYNRWADEHIKNHPPNVLLLQQPEIRIKLDGRIADAAKANPETVEVRVNAHGEDGVVVIDRPRRVDVLDVIKVNGQSLVGVAHDTTAQPENGVWSRSSFGIG